MNLAERPYVYKRNRIQIQVLVETTHLTEFEEISCGRTSQQTSCVSGKALGKAHGSGKGTATFNSQIRIIIQIIPKS